MVELNKLGRGQAIKEASNQIDAERAPALSDSRSSEFELTFNIPIRWLNFRLPPSQLVQFNHTRVSTHSLQRRGTDFMRRWLRVGYGKDL